MIVLARAISFLLSPIIVSFPALYLLIDKVSSNNMYVLKWAIISYFFILAVVIFVFMCVLFGIFSNFDVSKREERPLLFSFVGIMTFLYFVFLLVFNGPKILFVVIFAVVLGLIIISIVNQRIKASMHVAIISSIIFAVGIIYGGPYLLSLFLIPVMGWSRVKTKKHTPLETAIGAVLGGLLTIIVYVIAKQFFI